MSALSDADARRRYAYLRDRLVWNAHRQLRPGINTLSMLCHRWGDASSRRAVRAFARSIASENPEPRRWDLGRVLAALTSGASDVDVSARRLAEALRDLSSDLEELHALAAYLGRPAP
jgi:hypothetical protein